MLIESGARFPQHSSGNASLRQELNRLRTPQQFGERPRVYRPVELRWPRGPEANAAARSPYSDVDPPPLGHTSKSFRDMALANHEGGSIENSTVDFGLPRQPLQRIRVALDLEAMQETVHNGDVYTTCAMAKAKLVEHERIGIAVMILQHSAV
jgi:hypothetical protein